jgi:hypothetical protein
MNLDNKKTEDEIKTIHLKIIKQLQTNSATYIIG